MTLELAHITFDCADPRRVAEFWAAALGRNVDPEANEFFAAIGHQEAPGPHPVWFFIKVPEPKAAKNRLHVDLRASDRAAEVERLSSLGATPVSDHDEWGARWTVMLDPEGNEFCVGEDSTSA